VNNHFLRHLTHRLEKNGKARKGYFYNYIIETLTLIKFFRSPFLHFGSPADSHEEKGKMNELSDNNT